MRRRMTALLGLAGFMGLQATASGQTTFSWTNSGGGSYHTAGNWSPAGGPPGNDDLAQFNLTGTHTINFSQNGSDSGSFRVRQGTVTFQATNTTANHAWGFQQAGTQTNTISPLAGDTATEAKLILRDMDQWMIGENLTIGTGTGKTGRMEINDASWVGTGTTLIGVSGGIGELRVLRGLFSCPEIIISNGAIHIGGPGGTARLSATNLTVGLLGAGDFSVSTFKEATISNDLIVGKASTGSKAIIVGDFAKLEVGGNIIVGTPDAALFGRGLLSVQAGAEVVGEGNLYLGYNPNSNGNGTDAIEGNLVVMGTNGGLLPSRVTINGSTIIGEGSKGSAQIVQGAQFNGNSLIVGLNSDFQSEFRVENANSEANLTSVSVGQNGNGILRVWNGGRLNAQTVVIGSSTGNGTLSVRDANSLLSTSSNMTVGASLAEASATIFNSGRVNVGGTFTIAQETTATVDIQSGGRLDAANITIGTLSDSADGTLNVLGTNSRVNLTFSNSNIYVGRFGGAGTLNVSDSGTFGNLTASIRIASGVSSNNVAATGLLTGANGAQIQARDLVVGEFFGTGHVSLTGSTTSMQVAEYIWLGFNFLAPSSAVRGTIDINDRAQLSSLNLILGSSSQDNRITIRNGGRLTVTGSTEIGQQRGTLVIESGGRFTSNGGVIGSLDDAIYTGNGTVTVTGPGSLWNATGANALDVGRAGSGILAISQGGAVQGTNGTIGGYLGGSGNVTLNGNNSSLSLTGTLGIGGITAQGGMGTLNINPATSASVAGALSLWTPGTVNLNGGTLTMGSFNYHGGNFNWSAGAVNFSQNTTLTNDLLNNLIGTNHVIGQNKTMGSTNGTLLTVGSQLTVDGGRLSSGGVLSVNSGSTLVVNNGEASGATGITNLGSIVMNGPAAVMSGGTLDNRNSIRGTGIISNNLANNSNGQVRLASDDWLTFAGNTNTNQGSVQLLGGVLEFTRTLNTTTDGFISGHGTLLTSSNFQGGIGLVNTGTFAFSGGNTNIYGDVTNNPGGRIVTSGGSVTTFHDDVLHNGVEIRTSPGAYTIFFGSVSGASPYTGLGLVQFEGDLRPGNSPANVQFAGDVAFSVTARLVTELGGIIPGSEYDRLTVQGQIFLNGQLDVQLINGFLPNAGSSFTIIDNLGSNPVLGTFAGLGEGDSFISGGQLWNITYQGGDGNNVMLIAVPEPTTWALIGVSMLGAAGYYGYRRRNAEQSAEQEIGREDCA